ncbi:3-oxoacyl-[acyl-carrier-protein] synthase [Liquorilactobacillus sucicola DSM 21376 = JCM 15457]|uniref:Beta-ketoacyl-[acyl-carrier-protein] synthase III n=1 Tax=Liquorilactobacillus sucicola DSM 21376 = JCM 15457 TaxID=1423806 RepID=A0A023CVP8_9LACO|nr:beta-ketoacyl-ACP synthase III [Liquorilactobacillus sucicola]KRN06046.1 3-oxoacyl-[acyl-carrier-protein] synthase III [Liquorilactobacillus sucicola DSM 21376 = JCM 15457]GAJ25973.1 3-oxoacyl-[acyl-carrier-protein] synthase [Liquorilactobacillus sucicola DSM 21376 = JCM 15457]
METIKVVKTARCVPAKVVTNDDLSKIMDTSDEWISSRTGIKQRHISVGENTSQLCAVVAEQLLKKSGWDVESIDLLLVATMSPDTYTPATAALVQGKIGAHNALAFDISAACSGFIYGLNVAEKFMTSSGSACNRVMLIGGEVLSKVIDWTDRTTAVLFGDGAAGVLLERQEDGGASRFISSSLHTYGELGDKLEAGKTEALVSFPMEGEHKIKAFSMSGRDVYKFATHKVPVSIEEAVKKAGLTLDQIDYFVLHQANSRIVAQIAKRLNQPLAKFPMNIAKYGNTSAASVPLLLDELVSDKTIKRGQTIVLSGFGGGLTVGTQIIKY